MTTAAIVVLYLAVVGLAACLWMTLKQQGRLLLRLDDLDARLNRNGNPEVPSEPEGLAIGVQFPSFTLPNLAGEKVSLEEFRGKRVVLVNWNPQCGFCDLIAADLAAMQADLRANNAELVLLAHGARQANRKLAEEHGLTGPILLHRADTPLEPFARTGTPVAYLLDEEGRVAATLAVGANLVPELAREACAGSQASGKRLPGQKSLSESRIEREGLKAGTPAPLFRLPEVRGSEVSLEEYLGRKVLLVFSDPHCGPCERLAPQLVRLHQPQAPNGLSVLMVGRGDLEENRRKVEEYRLPFPVALQDRWKLSREYGIFATPVAFLIDENGIIARDVAQGMDAILALARTQQVATGA